MKGTTMTRTIRFILAAISLLFMAFIVAAPMLAHAQQTLPTMCGAEASGKRYLQGDVWAGKSPGQYVDELGYWQYCPAWVNPDGGDPRTPEPQPACPGRYGTETWYGADGVSECNSGPKGQTDSPYTKLHYTLHNGTQMIYDDEGETRGAQRWVCRAGVWRLMWESCETIKQAPASKSFGAPRLVVKPRVP